MRRAVRPSLVVLGVLVALVGAACQPGPTSVSARPTASEIDLGAVVDVVGQVAPARSGVAVVLERRSGSTWSQGAKATTDRTGAYRIRIRPQQAGIYALRVRAGSVVSPVLYVRIWDRVFLGDLWMTSGSVMFGEGPQQVGGVRYARALYSSECQLGRDSAEYDLWAGYRRFDAVVGFADGADPAARRNYWITVDGREVASGRVAPGQQRAVSLDVTGARAFRIEYQYGGLDCRSAAASGTFVLAEPVLWR